jgi:ParB-like chromosome segregation protein Spo0J
MTEQQEKEITESLKRFGCIDPLIVNCFPGRENVLVGGHQRLKIAKKLGYQEIPVVYVSLDPDREKELNLRLNKNQGEFDYDLLKEFDKSFLSDVGFSSEELDDIFVMDDEPEIFDLKKELEKLDISNIEVQVNFALKCNYLIC